MRRKFLIVASPEEAAGETGATAPTSRLIQPAGI